MNQEVPLNAKKRKALASSTFCGPDRSFPANDCNHVKAGLSLLGRYKGPGSKTSIRACLYRKAKSMKCFKSSKGEMADASVLIEFVRMYEEGALGFSEVAAMVSDMCHGRMSPGKLSIILSRIENGDVNIGFALMLKALQK